MSPGDSGKWDRFRWAFSSASAMGFFPESATSVLRSNFLSWPSLYMLGLWVPSEEPITITISSITIRMDDTITLLLLNGVQSTFLLPTTFKGKKRDPLTASSGTSCDGELSCTQYQRAWASLHLTHLSCAHVLGQGLANYGPQTKSGPPAAFINKVYIMSVDDSAQQQSK